MEDNQFRCTACNFPIDVGIVNAHLLEEESYYNDNFTFLCPFCAHAHLKAIKHVQFINWVEQKNFADFEDQHKPLTPLKLNYIWKEEIFTKK